MFRRDLVCEAWRPNLEIYQLLSVNSAQVRAHPHSHLFFKSDLTHCGLRESRRGRDWEKEREISWPVKRNKCQDAEIIWTAVIYTGVRFGSGSEVRGGGEGP